MLARYLTHPEVQIDPDVPVPSWGLSEIGRTRVQKLIANKTLHGTTKIVSSAETKAIETAEPIAEYLGAEMFIRHDMHENDRSATGFIPPDKFEEIANQFFAEPDQSIRGWEKAIDAQQRIVREAEDVLQAHQQGDVLFVGHGAVGTLLYCHIAHEQISRQFDQKSGGSFFTFEIASRQVLHHWRPMEELR